MWKLFRSSRWRLQGVLCALLIAISAFGAQPAYGSPPAGSDALGGSDAAREMWAAQAQYDNQRKSPTLGFALELAVPSLGNFYAGEGEEATLTLTGLLIGGFFLADGYGLLCETFKDDNANCKHKTFSLVQGWIFVIGSRLYGLTSAPMNVARSNRALRARLGLDSAWSMSVVPWASPRNAGLALSFRF